MLWWWWWWWWWLLLLLLLLRLLLLLLLLLLRLLLAVLQADRRQVDGWRSGGHVGAGRGIAIGLVGRLLALGRRVGVGRLH